MAGAAGLSLFALGASAEYGERVAGRLGVPLAPLEEREFEDGEHKARALVDVRRSDVFVVLSLYSDERQCANDKLCRLLFFIGALKDAGADRATVVAPYLCYARKDRKTQPNDPVTTKYIAKLLEAVGSDAVITMDVHNLAAFQNAFRCHTEHLEATSLFVDSFVRLAAREALAVVSPDIGGVKRADAFRRALMSAARCEASFAFADKRRSGGIVSGELLAGDVEGRTAIIIDDLISTGTTLRRVAVRCREAGAARVVTAAMHGLLRDGSQALLDDPALDAIVITDTVRPCSIADAASHPKLSVLDCSRLVADAIAAAIRW